jgi:hypothetical protein
MIIDDARLTKSCKNMHVSRFVPEYKYEVDTSYIYEDDPREGVKLQMKSDIVEKIRKADEEENSKVITLCGTK